MIVLVLLGVGAAARFIRQHQPDLSHALVYLTAWPVASLLICLTLDRDSVLAVLCIPARLVTVVAIVIRSVVGEILTWIRRRLEWSYLKGLFFGLNGYPFQSGVSQTPNSVAEEFYNHVTVSQKADELALERRQNALSSAYEIISETLARSRLSLVGGE
jgi:hypothetical protein